MYGKTTEYFLFKMTVLYSSVINTFLHCQLRCQRLESAVCICVMSAIEPLAIEQKATGLSLLFSLEDDSPLIKRFLSSKHA